MSTNTITAETLEGETLRCDSHCRRDFTKETELSRISQQTKEKEEILTEITDKQHQEETIDIRMRRKSR